MDRAARPRDGAGGCPILTLWFSLILIGTGARAGCVEDLLADPRFHWFEWPELHRQPPDLFTRKGPTLLARRFDHLPGGLREDERAFYGGIWTLLRDRARVYELISEIVATPGLNDARDLIEIMAAFERRHGIGVTRVDERLSGRDWNAIIARGDTMMDYAKVVLHLGQQVAPEGRWTHGVLSHRLQLHLVLREVERHPERFGHPRDVRTLYARLGDRDWNRTLDWSNTGIVDERGRMKSPLNLFHNLFDTSENNPSSPGYFLEYRAHWPRLPLDVPPAVDSTRQID